jgi:exosome complex component RRP4
MSIQLILPGELVALESNGFMPGIGTYSTDGKIFSSSLGYMKTIDKLINIIPQKIAYKPDQGDVIVGKVTSIDKGFWKVNINNKREAVLNIVNINLPQGEQRKRSQEDHMLMKNYFEENSNLSGEILGVNQDGGVTLQTRNLKYGNLKNGIFVKVNSNLIKKMKNHFVELVNNVKCILGRNGYIFIYYSTIKLSSEYFTDDQNTINMFNKEEKLSLESLNLIVLFKNIILCMNSLDIPIDFKSILKFFSAYCELKGLIEGGCSDLMKQIMPQNVNKNQNVLTVTSVEINLKFNIELLRKSLSIERNLLNKIIEITNSY